MALRVQYARREAVSIASVLLRQHDGLKNLRALIVAVGALHRMAECALSIEVLASKGFARDVATLVLTLMELRLDLQYMARVPGREVEWLSHTDEGRKPWKVAEEIRELFPNPGEREAELTNFRTYSMIKHANPAGASVSYPFIPMEGGLGIPDPGLKPRLLTIYLFAVGTNLCQSATAIAAMVHAAGFDIKENMHKLEEIQAQMDRLLHDHLFAMILRWFQQQAANPATSNDDDATHTEGRGDTC